MPFTFTVEDGTGIATANSYVTVADADDILTTNIHAGPEWDLLDNPTKEKLLAWASRYLDDRVTWRGYRVSETSGLRWPRSGVVDRDGILLASTTIPRQLKVAVAEMARYLIDTDRSTEQGQDALTRLKADVIELEFAEGYRLPKVPEHMQYLLRGLGSVSTGTGIGFKRIIR